MQQMNPMGQGQQTTNFQTSTNMPPQMNHGALDVLSTNHLLSSINSAFNEFLLCEQHIKDPELMDILNRQRSFLTDQYNITVEAFRSGQDPSHPTSSYQMTQSNDVIYGLKPSQPSKPNQDVSQLGDKCIASLMLGCMKKLASETLKAASESTNPVTRRVLADSIPNYLEMAYETFLYMNKKGYYQIPQLKQEDTQQLLQSHTTAPTHLQ